MGSPSHELTTTKRGIGVIRGATRRHTRPHWCEGRRRVRRARASCKTRGLAGVPVGGGRAWPDNEPTRHATAVAKASKVWRVPEGPEGLAAVPVGGGGAWLGFETKHKHTSAHQAPLVWRAPEGPEGTGGLRGAAPNEVRPPSLAGGRALRRPEHPWGTQSSPARRTAHAAPGTPVASAATQCAYSCSARPFLTARSRQYRKTSRKMPPKKMHAMAIQMPGGACRPYLRKYT